MTATVSPTPIPGSTRCLTSFRISCAPLGSSPTAVLDPLSALITGGPGLRAEDDHEVRDPAARPQIPAVSAPPTAR